MDKNTMMQNLARELQKKDSFNGAWLYAEKGGIVSKGVLGFRDPENTLPITEDTIFQLASVTKQFTAAAVMLVRRKGLVGETALNQFNSVAFRVFLATQLFKNVYDSSVEDSFDAGLAVYMLVAVLLVTLLTALAVNRLEPLRERRGVMIQGIFRSNFVLLSLPLMQSLFGDAGSGMVSLMIALVVPLFNVLAVVVLETYAGKEKTDPKKILRGIVKNPLIDATVLALIVKLTGLDLYRVSALKSVLGSVAARPAPCGSPWRAGFCSCRR